MAESTTPFIKLTAGQRRKAAKHENAQRRSKSAVRTSLQIVLDMEALVATDPAARRRKDDVGHAALLLAHKEHQRKNTTQGVNQTILARLKERRKRQGVLADIEHPTVYEWRSRLTTTDERAFVAHSLGIDVSEVAASLWWFAKSLTDGDRIDAYRECMAAQIDEMEQQDKWEQMHDRKSEKSRR